MRLCSCFPYRTCSIINSLLTQSFGGWSSVESTKFCVRTSIFSSHMMEKQVDNMMLMNFIQSAAADGCYVLTTKNSSTQNWSLRFQQPTQCVSTNYQELFLHCFSPFSLCHNARTVCLNIWKFYRPQKSISYQQPLSTFIYAFTLCVQWFHNILTYQFGIFGVIRQWRWRICQIFPFDHIRWHTAFVNRC